MIRVEKPGSFFIEEDQKFLYEKVLNRDINLCCEVGNFTGCTTEFFSKNLPNSIIYSVDINDHKVDEYHNVVKCFHDSLEFEPQHLDFVFLDGDHTHDHVLKELRHFSQMTNVIAGHDSLWVFSAIKEFIHEVNYKIELTISSSCTSWVMYLDKDTECLKLPT